MATSGLPAVGQTVELWFSGYDQYYPGKVTSLSPPETFDVLLDDGTSWPVNSKNNVWRYGRDEDRPVVAEDEFNSPENDVRRDDAKMRARLNRVVPEENEDDDDVAAPLAKQVSQSPEDEGSQLAFERQDEVVDTHEEPKAGEAEVIPETQTQELDASAPAVPKDGGKESEVLERQDAREGVDADRDDEMDTDVHLDTEAGEKLPAESVRQSISDLTQVRRKSGRAFRKSAVTTRSIGATPDPGNDSVHTNGDDADNIATRRRSARAEAIAADEAARASGSNKSTAPQPAPREPVASHPRGKRGVEIVPKAPEPSRSTRRTRQSAGTGQKRGVSELEEEEGEENEPEKSPSRPSPQRKRRRKANSESIPTEKNIATRSAATGNGSMLTPERITRSAAARVAFDPEASYRGSARQKDDSGLEQLSTQAVTAIAVDAALASAKAVLKPINDRLLSLRSELENISDVAKKAAAQLAEEPKSKRRGRSLSGSSPLSAAALESFHLDLSELIGGGEARIKAYSNLSEQEFDDLHRAIENQEAALRQLDRLLYAAQALSEKAKKTSTSAATPMETRSGRKTRSG